jgi:SAM-dependent methyltransferase
MGRRSASGAAPLLLLFESDRAAAEAEAERVAAEFVQHDRMRVHEADISPPDMGGQACWSIDEHLRFQPTRVYDPTTGAGCFPMAARQQWPAAEIVGVEARTEETEHVTANCDRYWIGDTFQAPASIAAPGSFDLVITNPPFSLIAELVPFCLTLVRPGGLVAFVCRLTWGDKPEADRLWRAPHGLAHIHEFAGRWRFRVGPNPKRKTPKHPLGVPYGVDSVGYRLLIWQRPISEPTGDVQYRRLDLLPAPCRRWRKTKTGLWIKPGTEYQHDPSDLEVLPEVPWRRAV